PRVIDPQHGPGRIAGVPVTDFSRHQLARLIGLVPQKPYLFSGAIASNLRFGTDDAGDDELWEALRIAQADEFVAEKEDRLEERVAQGGTNYSGGQRQRLGIARALTVTPQHAVLGRSFSALDVATDSRL